MDVGFVREGIRAILRFILTACMLIKLNFRQVRRCQRKKKVSQEDHQIIVKMKRIITYKN